MKKLILILSVFMVMGCNNDDAPNESTNEITATWNLINLIGGMAPSYEFNEGDIVWNIKKNNTINVKLKIEPPHNRLIFTENGTYDYVLDESKKTITLKGEKYTYTVSENELKILNNPSSDGAILIFKK